MSHLSTAERFLQDSGDRLQTTEERLEDLRKSIERIIAHLKDRERQPEGKTMRENYYDGDREWPHA